MRSSIFTILFSVLVILCQAQDVVSVTLKGSKTKTQISTLYNLPLIKFGAKYYQVKYTSVDAKGAKDTLSGLLMVPDDLKYKYPRLVYQHGTSDCKKCVPSTYPSAGGEEGELGLLFSGLGYIAILPDYVGMGSGRGFQTYVHASTIARATEDMLTALAAWTRQNGVQVNQQLFLTGYSQGGYASMAIHRHLEASQGINSVTAASHMSGPYSLSGVMRDLILGNKSYTYPAYIPNTVMGFNEVYEYYDDLTEIFKPEYVADIKNYYDGKITLTNLNIKLLQSLNANTGTIISGKMLRDDVLDSIRNQPNYFLNKVLEDNNVYDWSPAAPTRILYCKADDQVPYQNSIAAYDTMVANGAAKLEIFDVLTTANHGTCFNPAMSNTLIFFLNYQSILIGTDELDTYAEWEMHPNPADQVLEVVGNDSDFTIEIVDLQGRKVLNQHCGQQQSTIDIGQLTAGMYIVSSRNKGGHISLKKLCIAR